MGFILRKFIIFIALALAVSGPVMAKTSDSKANTSKAKSSLTKNKKKVKTNKFKKIKTKARKSTKTSSRAISEGKEQYKDITVNINKADAPALSAYLVGVGVVKATAIVDYRRTNGKFKSLKDLMNVDGIGEATLDGLKKNVSLSRGTTLAPEGYVMDELPKSNKKRQPKKAKSTKTTGKAKSLSSTSTRSEKSSRSNSSSSRTSGKTKVKKIKKAKVLKKKKLKKKTKKKKSSS